MANVHAKKLVGAVRFELTTPCAQGRCATGLRYAPTLQCSYHSSPDRLVSGTITSPPALKTELDNSRSMC